MTWSWEAVWEATRLFAIAVALFWFCNAVVTAATRRAERRARGER